MDCSMPGFPVLYHLPEFAQIHVHGVSDAIQPSHPLSPTSALSLSQHQESFPVSRFFASGGQYWSFSFSQSFTSQHVTQTHLPPGTLSGS